MGRNTVAELIARGQNMNDYNNTGINTNAKWVDAFNSALQDLVEDINLTENLSIPFVTGTREYDLPDDFFELQELSEQNFACPVPKRRRYENNGVYYSNWFQGYFILNKGDRYVIDLFEYTADQTFTGIYTRYPALLSVVDISTQRPEVPTIGENALIYFAISRALRNNNQPGQASEIERMYELERRKIRDAAARALIGGW